MTTANEMNLATKFTDKNLVNYTVLLQAAVAVFKGKTGQYLTRLLFDSGSQRTFVTKNMSAKLQCKLIGNKNLAVGVLGGKMSDSVLRRVTL